MRMLKNFGWYLIIACAEYYIFGISYAMLPLLGRAVCYLFFKQ